MGSESKISSQQAQQAEAGPNIAFESRIKIVKNLHERLLAANSGKLRPGDSFKDLNKEFEKFVGRKWKSGKKGFDINKWEQEVRAKSGQEALGVKLESNGEGVVEDIGSSPDTKTSPESESPAQEDNPVAPEAKQGDSGQQISHSAQDEGSSEPTPSQPSSDSVVESGSSDGEQWPEVKPATSQEAEVSAELARMPEADQEKLRVGLENFGYFVEAKKNAGMARLAEFCFRRLNKKSAMGRWMQSLGEGFRKSEEKAVESMQSNPDTVKGKLGKTALSQLKLGVNILRYGRIVADFAGYTALAPFRYVMLGSMAFSKGSEAAKEARFKNEQVKERTRIQNPNEAAEMAWSLHAKAKESFSGSEPSKEALLKAYRENMPQDIKRRLEKELEKTGVGGFLEAILRKHISFSIGRIEKKLNKIDSDESLSDTQKREKKDKIYTHYERTLNDYDRMLSDAGVVDGLAWGARAGEKAGKAVVWAMTIDTLFRMIDKVADIPFYGDADVADLAQAIEKNLTMEQIENTLRDSLIENNINTKEGIIIFYKQLKQLYSANGENSEDVLAACRNIAKEDFGIDLDSTQIAEQAAEQAADQHEVAGSESSGAEQAEIIGYQGGRSVWQEAQKQLEQRFEEFENLPQGARIYRIDQIKDLIVANPQKYNLPDDIDFTRMSSEQIAGIDWEKAIQDAGFENDGFDIDPNLSDAQESSIVSNGEEAMPSNSGTDAVDADSSNNVDSAVQDNVGQHSESNQYDSDQSDSKSFDNEKEIKTLDERRELSDIPEKELTEYQKEITRAIEDYNRQALESSGLNWENERMEAIEIESVRAEAAETLLESSGTGEFERFLEFDDYREALRSAMNQAISGEISKGEGFLRFGKLDPEKARDLFVKLGRTFGLSESESKLFVSTIENGMGGTISKEGLRSIKFYDKLKGGFVLERYRGELKAFGELADINSKDLDTATSLYKGQWSEWKPVRVVIDGARKIVNVKLSDGRDWFLADSDGDGEADIAWGDNPKNKRLMSLGGLKKVVSKALGK